MKKIFSFLLIGILSLGILTGCSQEDKGVSIDSEDKNELVIKHELGESKLDSMPERVVVFDYGILDSMDELGLGDRVIGLAKKSLPDYLDKYKSDKYEDLGSLQEPNFEKIYELEPDLIIIGDRQAKLYKEFQEIAPTLPISVMNGEYMALLRKNLGYIGEIFDMEEEVNKKIATLEGDIEELNKLAKEKEGKALFIMANDGELNVYGRGSRFGVLFNEFGLSPVDENIDTSTHGQKVGYEYIIDKDPDYIFVMDRGQIAGGDTTAKDVMENDLMKTSKAYKNKRIIYLNSPVWYVASGGLESTAIMVEDVVNGLK